MPGTAPFSADAMEPATDTDFEPEPEPEVEPALAGRGETYIVTLSQTDPSCPSERSCPGPDSLAALCGRTYPNFHCDTSWSSGMAGTFVPGEPGEGGIQGALADAADRTCPACRRTLKILTIRDSPLSGSLSIG